ncbi:hypothetical protein C7445_10484 [Alicyclobacillus sacchari]|uniref:Uncharacterized protein n=1 Tax=Alicyclobacillus sacchari TaxID=392010 RepID=A0A4R8LPY2_9BACL|nr:hypothetical protein [Alicyclobacillus sacchari]TDY49573.1 hypothetical protein C7445_10484 [Alicyclobacillus sacchari]GMA58561.1 hypothetical protein GCM10025858_30640 [Alicyclobacillus sacchari]
MNDDDNNLRERMKGRADVPFRPELKDNVLAAVRAQRSERRTLRPRWAFVSTMGALAACVAIALTLTLTAPMSKEQQPARRQSLFHSAATVAFPLAKAPIAITNVRIGTLPGEPKNSCVIATLKNLSKHPILEPDVFGVLSFTPQGASTENWLTFVNAPSAAILPGQSVEWGFHPSGPHAGGSQALAETPHLVFYLAQTVPSHQADTIWRESRLDVTNVQLAPRPTVPGANWQSVQVNATLWNHTSAPIDLRQTRAVIWFSKQADDSFLAADSIRFLFHMTPEIPGQSWPAVVEPGQHVQVAFRVLSTNQSDFFSRTPHVMAVDAPLVQS